MIMHRASSGNENWGKLNAFVVSECTDTYSTPSPMTLLARNVGLVQEHRFCICSGLADDVALV